MKKLRLRDLQALAHEFPSVSRLEQRGLVGGGTGSNLDPFSQEEYRTMLAQGTWEGGFVAGDVQDPTGVSMQYIPSSSSSGEEELLPGQNGGEFYSLFDNHQMMTMSLEGDDGENYSELPSGHWDGSGFMTDSGYLDISGYWDGSGFMTESGYWDGSGWIDPATLSGDWDKDGGSLPEVTITPGGGGSGGNVSDGGSSGGTLNGIGGIIGGGGNNGGGHNPGGSYGGGNGISGDNFTYNGGQLPEVVVKPDNNTGGYNVNNAIDYLNDHAHSSSQGKCAKYVRLALEAGGLSTNGHPVPACDYDDFLPAIGFHEISKSNYIPQRGDIIVLEAVPNHRYGHIAMYNGTHWVSDFVQKDMWGGSAYRNADYTLFRR